MENIQHTIKIQKLKKKMIDSAKEKYGNIMPCGPVHNTVGEIVRTINDCFSIQKLRGKQYLCFEFNTEDNGSFSVHEEI